MDQLKPFVPVLASVLVLLLGQGTMTVLAATGALQNVAITGTRSPAPPSARLPADPPASAGPEVSAMVRQWAQLQTTSDLPGYSALYADDFVGIKKTKDGSLHPYPSKEAWMERKQAAFGGGHEVTVNWIVPEVSADGQSATVRFSQYWRNHKGYADRGFKQLDMRRTGSRWLITREEMLTSSSWDGADAPSLGAIDLVPGDFGEDSFEWAFARDQFLAVCSDGDCDPAVARRFSVEQAATDGCDGSLKVPPKGAASLATGCPDGTAVAFGRAGAHWQVTGTHGSGEGGPVAGVVGKARAGDRIDAEDLSDDCTELWEARNWVYARHGYAFSSERARTHFGGEPDYRRDEAVTGKTVSSRLTAEDVANRDLLVAREKTAGCR